MQRPTNLASHPIAPKGIINDQRLASKAQRQPSPPIAVPVIPSTPPKKLNLSSYLTKVQIAQPTPTPPSGTKITNTPTSHTILLVN